MREETALLKASKFKERDVIQTIGAGADNSTRSPVLRRYWQPLIAYVFVVVASLWITIPSHILFVIGRALGEHWYSVYNCMLAAAATLLFVTASRNKMPALAWRVWDLSLCCAIISLGGKLIPLDRPSGGPHGFPSGHALTAFAAACLIMNTFPKLSPYAFVIAVAVGWSRVEIREHYPYQVIVGALLGILVGVAVSNAKDGRGVILPRIFGKKISMRSGTLADD